MKIKRCPFCGSKADLIQQYNDRLKTYFLRVECQMCGARGGTTSTKEDVNNDNWQENKHCKKAVALWNNRLPMEVIKKWARDWIRPVYYNEDQHDYEVSLIETNNFIMIADLDDIVDSVYKNDDDNDMGVYLKYYYGKLV